MTSKTSETGLIQLIDQLETEHVEVREALDRIVSATAEQDAVALQSALAAGAEILGTGLNQHSLAEDEDLFPGIAPLIGEGMVGVFVEEHVRIRALRDQIYERMAKGEADFGGCTEFCELLTSHMEREDVALFPSARGLLAD
jgi:hemerythrin-like domain-containing protein